MAKEAMMDEDSADKREREILRQVVEECCKAECPRCAVNMPFWKSKDLRFAGMIHSKTADINARPEALCLAYDIRRRLDGLLK